jgi:hypothetical protein
MIAGAALAAASIGLLGWWFAGDSLYWTSTMPSRDFSGVERVLTQGRVQMFYLSLLLWPAPSRLNLDHDFAVSRRR